MEQATAERPAARGELLEVEIDSLAFGGRGVARAGRLRRLRRRRAAGRPGAGRGDEIKAPLRRGEDGRAAPPGRRPRRRQLHPRRRALPGSALAGTPLRAPARPQAGAGRATRCGGSAASTGSSWRRSSRRSSSGATATSSSTPSASATTARLTLGFHARGRWDRIVDVEDCKLASERGNAARNAVRDWARLEAIAPYDGRARSGVLRNLVVREGRRTGQIQTRLVTSRGPFPRPPVDLHTVIEGPSGGTDGPTGALGEERLREELCGLELEISHGAFFQTNTEMAERLYARGRRVRRAERRRAGLRPLLRDRHDRADDGGAGRRGLGAGDRPRGDRRRRAQRRAQRDRATPASSPPTRAPGCGR